MLEIFVCIMIILGVSIWAKLIVYWQLGILGVVLGVVLFFCWCPRDGEISYPGCIYEYEEVQDYTNPLYVRGFFRKKKKKISLFSDLKGLYICQIVSLVLMSFTIIYFGVMKCYRPIFLIENILTACFVFLMFVRGGLKTYYRKCYKEMFRYAEKAEGIWLPFSYLFQPFAPKWRPYKPFHCQYHVAYEEMKKKLEHTSGEKGYVFVENFKEDEIKEFNVFTRLRENNLDVFALIHIERLEKESWDEFNYVFENFWKKYIAERYETKQMAFTFLICVDEYSRELRKKKNGIYGVDSKLGRYRLPVILAYSENSTLDIPVDCRMLHGEKRHEHIRNELLEMLDLSLDFNGKRYFGKEEE